MRNPNLTYNELRDYLDRYNTDPMVRKLLEHINDKEENIIEGLVEVGMDTDGRIESDSGWYLPGPYIQHLRNELSNTEDESLEWEQKYYDMKDERDKLKARSVAELLDEMRWLVERANADRDSANRVANQYKEINAELEEKINVWSILEK